MGFLKLMIFWACFGDFLRCFGALIEECESTHYLNIGETGVIQCNFYEEFVGVFWYNSTKTAGESPILKFVGAVKSGDGYESGEYDIFGNGSLIINNVSPVHDGNYTVIKFQSLVDDPVQFFVSIVTTVMPSNVQPLIDKCEVKGSICFAQLYSSTDVGCFVRNARPVIMLKWILRTSRKDVNLTYNTHIDENGITSTTFTTTKIQMNYSSKLSLLLCKAHCIPGMLHNDETFILVQHKNVTNPPATPLIKQIELGSKLNLSCSESYIALIVWKKALKRDGYFEVISYGALFQTNILKTNQDGYQLQNDGSLVVPQIDVIHEGFYNCVFEGDGTGNEQLFEIISYVPVYPEITGCPKHEPCILDVYEEGNLTCSVRGVRPLVQLEMTTFSEKDSSFIEFTNSKVSSSNTGDVYDVQLTINYQLNLKESDRLTLKCQIIGVSIQAVKSTTTFELLLTNGRKTEYLSGATTFIIFVFFIIICTLMVAIILRGKCKRSYSGEPNLREENISLRSNGIEDQRTFVLTDDTTVGKVVFDYQILKVDVALKTTKLLSSIKDIRANMELFTTSFTSLYGYSSVCVDTTWGRDFNRLRDDTRYEAEIYIRDVLPLADDLVKLIQSLFSTCQLADFSLWIDNISDVHDDVHSCTKMCDKLVETNKVVLKALSAKASKIEKLLSKQESVSLCDKFNPNCNASLRYVVQESVIPSLKNIYNNFEEIQSFFNFITTLWFSSRDEKHWESLGDIIFSIFRERASEANDCCKEFIYKMPRITLQLQTVS